MSKTPASRPGLSTVRLLRRLALLVALLTLGEVLVGRVLPGREYDRNFRPWWTHYGRYLEHIRAYKRRHPDRPVIVFAGASVAWGFCNTPGNALPDQFERALHARYRTGPLSRAKVFNVCLQDNSAATDYYVLQALGGMADAIYLQVHYRFFNLGWRAKMALPVELMQQMGEWPTAGERRDLGGEWLRADPNLATGLSLWLARHSALYRDRLALRELVYGDSLAPGQAGYEAYEDWLERTGREHRQRAQERLAREATLRDRDRWLTTCWDDLPARRRLTPAKDVSVLDFGAVRPSNRNLHFLRRIARWSRQTEEPLFCYTAVLNARIMDPVSHTWRRDYRRSMALVRPLFTGPGQVFMDYNEIPAPPTRFFHDFDHLVDEGAAWQAARLLDDSRGFLEGPVLARFAGKQVSPRQGRRP